MISNLVDVQQMALIKGRQIIDAVLVANEVIDILCKLDIEKADDHLNWEYLLSIPKKLSLGKNGYTGSDFVRPLLAFLC